MSGLDTPVLAWLIFVGAAVLEVAGDACVRQGLRGNAWAAIVVGCGMLAGYGLLVNVVRWDFSKLLGVYLAVFAVVSVLAAQFYFREDVPESTWVGVGIIVLGGLMIQFGEPLLSGAWK